MNDHFVWQEDMALLCARPIPWSELRESRVLITGATGMIPSYVALTLMYYLSTHGDTGAELTLLVRDREKARRLFRPFWEAPWLHICVGDVCTWQTREAFDFILHGASPADPRSFGADPAHTFLPNVQGTWSMLELARRSRAKGFVFLSSGEVSGQLVGDQVLVDECTYGIVDPLEPRSCYSEGKRAGETLCAIWRRQYGVPASVIRISHTYGPTMDLEHDSRVFSEFVSCVVHRRNIVLKSDGSAIRPFCYLTDAVDAILRVLLNPSTELCYLMAGEDYLSILKLAEMLCQLFPERDLHVVRERRPEGDSYLEACAQPVYRIDTSKLKALGWAPQVPVQEGFRRTVQALEESGLNQTPPREAPSNFHISDEP